MPEAKRPLKVFLCHAHSDKNVVRDLYLRLTKDGVDAWLDKEKLLPGQDWEHEIRKAVREADVVVVCLSKQFNQAGFRQKEVRLALDTAMEQPEGEIFIIPARLDECDTLESLRKWHWVDLFEEDGYERLMRALRARANRIGVALQGKRNWLPKVTTPHESEKSVVEKIPVELKPVPTKREEKSREAIKPEPEKPKPSKTQRKQNTAIIIALIGFAIIAGLLTSTLIEKWFSSAPMPTYSATATESVALPAEPGLTSTKVLVSQELVTPSLTSTLSFTAAITPLPMEITDAAGVQMVLVPNGNFIAGEKHAESEVYLPAFYIDKYEVTNSRYSQCVSNGVCQAPAETVLSTYDYYGNSQYDDHPVVWVNITMAKSYCSWRGGRLPSELEWEKAARGTDGRIYPWGNSIDGAPKANSYGNKDGYEIASPVGSFPEGVSPYGAFDMAGNVWEWTSNITSFGGSWVSGDLFVYDRNNIGGGARFDVGFRCARDTTAVTPRGTLTSTQTLTPSIPTFTPLLTNTPEAPESGFILISIDKNAYIGGKARARIRTQPGTQCSLVFYLPSGKISTANGVGNITADKDGYCAWSWSILGNVKPGFGTVVIIAGGQTTNYYIKIE